MAPKKKTEFLIELYNKGERSAANLMKITGAPSTTVYRVIKNIKENKYSIPRGNGPGRKTILDAQDRKILAEILNNQPGISRKALGEELKKRTKKNIHNSTLVRELRRLRDRGHNEEEVNHSHLSIEASSSEMDLFTLLETANLSQYLAMFTEQGGDDIGQLVEADDAEFKEITELVGMSAKPLHVKRLRKAIDEYKNSLKCGGVGSLLKKKKPQAPTAPSLLDRTQPNISEAPSTPGLLTTDSNLKGVNWRACLYGLDTDEGDKSSLTRNQPQDDQDRNSLPLPPPPHDLDLKNNNQLESDNYNDLYELISIEDNVAFSSTTLAPPPAHFNQSVNSQGTTLTPAAGLSINKEPTKDTPAVPPLNAHSSSSSFNTVIQNPVSGNNPRPGRLDLDKHWNNLACGTLPVNTPVTTSLVPGNFEERKQQLNKHLNGTSACESRIYANEVMYKSCPNVMRQSEENRTLFPVSAEELKVNEYRNEEFMGTREFKHDHLVDINPKRLTRGHKFRCRVHDVIDEWGRFWIEVIYSKEEEEKFQEVFKPFRLCSRINEAPKTVHPSMRVSAFYKNDWHRAVVLEATKENKARVRFVDIGIVKNLDIATQIRQIDQKFFNCPLKALQCSVNLTQADFHSSVGQARALKQFKLTKDVRKLLTRLIYKRVLFAKIVSLTSLGNDSALYANVEEARTVCQVILSAQFHSGIIDIFMYVLSKFDKPHYEALKRCHGEQQRLAHSNGESDDESLVTGMSVTDTNTNTAVGQRANEKVLDSGNMQLLREEYIQSYGGPAVHVAATGESAAEEEEDFTEDETEEETEQGLLSESVNHRYFWQHETITLSDESSSTESYFSVSEGVEEEYFC